MRVLLDTHAWLWFYQGNSRLSKLARELMESSGNSKLVSPASCWELAIKISMGKLQLSESYQEMLQHAILDNGFEMIPIGFPHLVQLSALPFPEEHKDPFDRLIVSQAIVEDIPVVSVDPQLDAYPIRRLWSP